jgi:hypothetical protein
MNHTLLYVLNQLKNESHVCKFEKRPAKFMFGVKNYGELPLWVNKADGDPWDVFAPGYKTSLKNKNYSIGKVIGIFFLENGNHKIAVRIKNIPVDSIKYENEQIEKYARKYSDYTKVNGKYLPIKKIILEK